MTADEVNFLIRRYLQESGYQHTAFMFGSEAMLDQTNFSNIDLPPQALITILKKGMLYMQLEKGINERARTEDSPENIIISIIDAIKNKEPIRPPSRQAPKSRQSSQQSQHSAPQTQTLEIKPSSIISLRGHYGEVFCGSWSPDGQYFASGSSDATAIIWEFQNNHYQSHTVLDHASQQSRSDKDIAALCWNSTGTLLATGCFDGTSRIWTNHGELKFVLQRHTDSIFTVQFSPNDEYLATGSSDTKVIIWQVSSGEIVQTFTHHTSRVTDISWLDNKTFATSSSDLKICVCNIGNQKPIFTLQGHTNDINKICWDPTKRLLASCSDDTTIRIWRPYDRMMPILLQGHTDHVYSICWLPNNNNFNSNNGGNNNRIIASASFDFTIRIWDIQNHSCVMCLNRHKAAVYTLSFSPNGKYLVSGGSDSKLCFWRMNDGNLVAECTMSGGVFEAQWNNSGNCVAACLSDATVAIIPDDVIKELDKK
ncbi:F-box-like/WD repeat-containing protein TBL1X [Histomonas meleagridis]|uniref:F-box-like/WD repeat-containing protein TBL1X n=1 Tax=Histomonas meleagridis TaxID=135588 RepID=UPI003559C393|nr:F-box-like/WD repeat-containing protein TBL1X [Histomonas meleagridis]KAH0801535.1 F-box-like/WD repeat-containing protein TBL1X [Histomonas meleagridis]